MLTVSGGKLTTFRLMARDALKLAQRLLPAPRPFDVHAPVLDAIPAEAESALSGLTIKPAARLRLAGRYAADLPSFLMGTPAQAITPLPGAPYLLAELLWAAKHEAVQHLDDLMLRRTRLGLLLRNGALTELDELRQSLQPALAWSDPRWDAERTAYARLIQGCYNSQH